MTEKQDKEYVHWQDLAEQLGADTSQQINDYFGGTVDFSEVELDASDLPDTLPAPAEANSMKPNHDNESTVGPATETKRSASDPADNDSGNSDAALEIGWVTPDVVAETSPSSAQTPAKKPEKRQRNTKKPETKVAEAAPTAASPPDTTHWDSLASSLGLVESPASEEEAAKDSLAVEAEPPTISPDEASQPVEAATETPPAKRKRHRQPKASQPKASQPKASQPKASQPKASQPKASQPKASQPMPTQSSGFGAGIIDFGEPVVSSDEIANTDDLDEVFLLDDDDTSDDLNRKQAKSAAEVLGIEETEVADVFEEAADVFEEVADVFEEVADVDSDYVEFEVEDLDPTGGRPRRRRKPSGDRDRVPRRKSESRGNAAEVTSDADRPTQEARDEEQVPTEKRPRRRRRKRAEETDAVTSVKEEQPRKRRSRRDSVASEESPSDDLRIDEDESDSEEIGDRPSRKPAETVKKLPTWNDTIDVIVEANISSRGKKPARRKRSSPRTRRGGQSRDQK